MNRLYPGSTRTRVLLATLLTAVLGVTGLGVMPTAFAAPKGSIEGTVTDAADDAGIKGIEVTAYESDGVTSVASTRTNKDGIYSLKLPAGNCRWSSTTTRAPTSPSSTTTNPPSTWLTMCRSRRARPSRASTPS